jgi:GDP-4-dehydro-6-deoxy-D-mannose reductase
VRVLVTGIDGFVGSHAAEFLLGLENVEVHGTVLLGAPITNLAPLRDRLHLHTLDIRNDNQVEELFFRVRPDRVIHLAGQAFVPSSVANPTGTFDVNIQGGITILEAARRLRERENFEPAVLIVSTGEVYGKVDPARQPITEDFPLSPINPYAASKASLDMIAQSYMRTFGMRVIIARPFTHVGPRQNPSFVCSDFGKRFAEISLGRSKPTLHVGNLEARRDFTDVRDIVRAYWLLFDHSSQELVFNVCASRVFQIREVINLYCEITGIRAEVTTEPARVRPYDVALLWGNNDRLVRLTQWKPLYEFRTTLTDLFHFWQHELTR